MNLYILDALRKGAQGYYGTQEAMKRQSLLDALKEREFGLKEQEMGMEQSKLGLLGRQADLAQNKYELELREFEQNIKRAGTQDTMKALDGWLQTFEDKEALDNMDRAGYYPTFLQQGKLLHEKAGLPFTVDMDAPLQPLPPDPTRDLRTGEGLLGGLNAFLKMSPEDQAQVAPTLEASFPGVTKFVGVKPQPTGTALLNAKIRTDLAGITTAIARMKYIQDRLDEARVLGLEATEPEYVAGLKRLRDEEFAKSGGTVTIPGAPTSLPTSTVEENLPTINPLPPIPGESYQGGRRVGTPPQPIESSGGNTFRIPYPTQRGLGPAITPKEGQPYRYQDEAERRAARTAELAEEAAARERTKFNERIVKKPSYLPLTSEEIKAFASLAPGGRTMKQAPNALRNTVNYHTGKGGIILAQGGRFSYADQMDSSEEAKKLGQAARNAIAGLERAERNKGKKPTPSKSQEKVSYKEEVAKYRGDPEIDRLVTKSLKKGKTYQQIYEALTKGKAKKQ